MKWPTDYPSSVRLLKENPRELRESTAELEEGKNHPFPENSKVDRDKGNIPTSY